MSKAYSSNLTQAQLELLAPLIPAAKPGGRPREVNIWEVLNAIFYVLMSCVALGATCLLSFPTGKQSTRIFVRSEKTERG